MAITDPGTLLEKMGSPLTKRKIMLHILGVKRRLKIYDKDANGNELKTWHWSPLVPMLIDCPPITTWTIGAGFAEPSKAQIKMCLDYWIATEYSPDFFVWQEDRDPLLEPLAKSTTEYRPSHSVSDEDVAEAADAISRSNNPIGER